MLGFFYVFSETRCECQYGIIQMIRWDLTSERYGYNEETAKTKDRIVIQCSECSETMDRHYGSVKSTLKRNVCVFMARSSVLAVWSFSH
jgi:hypothetical protein